jgi:hypothetical protein
MSDQWEYTHEGEGSVPPSGGQSNAHAESVFFEMGVGKKGKAKQAKPAKPEFIPPKLTTEELAVGKEAQTAIGIVLKNAVDQKGKQTWAGWMTLAKGYATGRAYATRAANGVGSGKNYSTAMSKYLSDFGLDKLDKATRSRLISCYEHRVEIERRREEQEGAKAMNNPILVWNAFPAA